MLFDLLCACTHARRYVDWFILPGPGGQHACLVTEHLGSSLSDVMRRYGGGLEIGLPMPVVQALTRQMTQALDYLHRWAGGHVGGWVVAAGVD